MLLLAGGALLPGVASAQVDGSAGKPGQGAPASGSKVQQVAPAVVGPQVRAGRSTEAGDETPIISDEEFDKSLPPLADDMDAPLEAMTPAAPVAAPVIVEPIEDAAELDVAGAEAEIAAPLAPLAEFDTTPVADATPVNDQATVEIRYVTQVTGLDEIDLTDRFEELSALEDGDGRAANAAIIGARAREDEQLAIRLMRSLGYYDATAVSTIAQRPASEGGGVTATLTAVPGPLYRLGSIRIDADPTVPPSLIADNFALRVGDAIDAVRVQAAEAKISLELPRQGYPFAEVGQRDILLDETAQTGDYVLPVTIGPRASFRGIQTQGDAVFDAEHIDVLTRFRRDDLYNGAHVDDLRDALIATSLFSTVSVEPVRTGETGPDGTEYVDMLVRQTRGPARTLAAEGGYSTGQGLRAEVSWTHRNLFPPEGALILTGVGGTQEQGASATYRRSNAGQRDRTFQLIASALRSDVEAFTGLTGTLGARMSYDSTPLWQKPLTYSYGIELVGTSEDRFDLTRGRRERGVYFIAALPLFAGWDKSDDLLNPTRGFRLKGNLSPETSVRGAARPYVRAMVEGTAYYPIGESIVIGGRARFGTIQGIDRNDLAPSRRYYAGGGGSVRGFGYQELGPRAPDGKPIGGRSFNEFAVEARYRFGNFGIVPFIDAGQVYEGSVPGLTNLRFGAGIGGRMYTNFGPLRIDVATPIAKKPGESRIALYISIGQAF